MATVDSNINKNAKTFADGTDGVTGQGKKVQVSVGGTVETGDKFNIKLGQRNFGFVNKPTGKVSSLQTLNKKLYATSETLLYFSAIDAPTRWEPDVDLGAGFINMFNEFTGAESLRALAAYSGRLAIFARTTIQIWNIDVDPSRNSQAQVLDNIGVLAPASVVQVGDVDVFLLADSGIRSLRSRDINNIAFTSDVGNPVDVLVLAEIRALGSDAELCRGLIDPTDGRYWLVMGDKVFVFSHFTGSKVSAWSTYEPGFTITNGIVHGGRIWCRGDDGHLYLYGGADNNTYDDCEVTGVLPFLSSGTPATEKTYTSFDAVVEGEWTFSVGTNPEFPNERDTIGTLWAPSFDMRRIPMEAVGTHFSIAFSCEKTGYARLSNMIVHYNAYEAG
jgi:hypothetical protein